jgi:TrmH family RNA methyltransferase
MTKAELKYFASLLQKKHRDDEKKFIAEGKKIVSEGIESKFNCELIIATNEFAAENKLFLSEAESKKIRIELINNHDFKKISDTVTPQGIAAVFHKPEKNHSLKLKSKIAAAVDEISDPGNVGTILRNCDWFGITEILLSKNSADVYNPKTIRGSMGSIFHLNIFEEVDLTILLNKLKKDGCKIICADLKGKNLFEYKPEEKSIIIFSNEAKGPSSEIINLADEIITIPKYGNAESLNVASASAVILAHLVK